MTRGEAQAILSITPQNARLAALDFRASRATSTSDELSQYRIEMWKKPQWQSPYYWGALVLQGECK
jgi:hypothetical protein